MMKELEKFGLEERLPKLDVFTNQFPDYSVELRVGDYSSICPKDGRRDHGEIRIAYRPDRVCVELSSLIAYVRAYRELKIFMENIANRMLRDFVEACQPRCCSVEGRFNMGGESTVEVNVTAYYQKKEE